MENLEYSNEINTIIEEATLIAYKNSPAFIVDKENLLKAANSTPESINVFIQETMSSIKEEQDRSIFLNAVCKTVRNFIIMKQ